MQPQNIHNARIPQGLKITKKEGGIFKTSHFRNIKTSPTSLYTHCPIIILYPFFKKLTDELTFSSLQPQILQPFNPCLREHLHQGRRVKTPPTEGRSDLTRNTPKEGKHIDAACLLQDPMEYVSRPAGPDELSHLLSTHLHLPGSGAPRGVNARDSPASAAQPTTQHEWRAPAGIVQNSVTPASASSASPRMLQPPRLHKRVSLPALKPGGTGGLVSLKPGCSLGPVASRTKQLPPPSRGLPCYNGGPQVQPRSLCRTSLVQPGRSEPCSDPRGANTSLEEPYQRTLKDPGSAKILIPMNRSCLPKPKIP